MEGLIADENVPGLYVPAEKVVDEYRTGSWKFQRLADGCVFASEWRGAEDAECMVSHALFSADDARVLAALFGG